MRSRAIVPARRGQPLLALGGVLGGWIAVRAMLFVPPILPLPEALRPLLKLADQRTAARSATEIVTHSHGRPEPVRSERDAAPVEPVIDPPLPRIVEPTVAPIPPEATRFAAGQNLLWMAAMRAMPLHAATIAGLTGQAGQNAAPDTPFPPAISGQVRRPSRRSGDAWAFYRPAGLALPGTSAVGPSYGGSQAGAILRFDLAQARPLHPQVYLRGASALASQEQDFALGASLRPVSALPLRAYAEARVTRTGGRTFFRPAAFVAGSVDRALAAPDSHLRLRGFGEAGYVAGRGATGFADGNLILEHPLGKNTPLAAGAGAWGGAQRSVGRIDIGPTLSLRLRLGETTGRLSADYRLRVAGNAQPASGAALTLSAGF